MNNLLKDINSIANIEGFVSNFLSDIFASSLTAICINSEQDWLEDTDSFLFELEGEELALGFKASEAPFPYDWLLARFARLLHQSADKYQSLFLKENLEKTDLNKNTEIVIYGSDSSKELCRVLIAFSDKRILEKLGNKNNYQNHPLEEKLPVNIKLKSLIPCDRQSLNIGDIETWEEQIICLEIAGKEFFSKAKFNQGNISLMIMEEEMEKELNKIDTEACYLEVFLGNIKISLNDFLSLRPGNVIKFDMEEEVEVKLCFANQPWGKGTLSFQDSETSLKITEIGAMITENKQHFFENSDYLVRD